MTRRILSLPLLLLLVSPLVLVGSSPNSSEGESSATASVPSARNVPEAISRRARVAYLGLPLTFDVNEGQTHKDVKFLSRGSGYTLFLTSNAMVLSLHQPASPVNDKPIRLGDRIKRNPDLLTSNSGIRNPEVKDSSVHITLRGANPNPTIEGLDLRPGKSNYFIGNDPRKWHTNVPSYAKVRYHDVYPGVDLVCYGNQGQLEHDFVVRPGTDPGAIRLVIDDTSISLDERRNLSLRIPGGVLTLQRPRVYQEVNDTPREISADFSINGEHEVGFRLGSYDKSLPLIIDPVLIYSTYLGGSGDENDTNLAVDSAGSPYLFGYTYSSNFPVSGGAFQSALRGGWDDYVIKLDPAGTAIVYSTYLGGGGGEDAFGIAVDGSGNAFLAGQTNSSDFPTTGGAFQTTYSGGDSDGFVVKLNATGSALLYSTYLGGSNSVNQARAIAIDSAGDAYVAGSTTSSTFPTTPGAFQTAFGAGPSQGFVSKLNPTGSALVYSTYFGGNPPLGIAVDGSGDVYIAGSTTSTVPTTPGAFQPVFAGGNSDGFVAKLNPSGSGLVYATYVGGTGDDVLDGIAIDGAGNAYSSLYTNSPDFPVTPGAFQTAYGGGYDSGVIKLNSSGSALVYSTYLGGNSVESGHGIVVDAAGNATVFGETASANFPVTTNAFQSNPAGGGYDAFITTLNANGSSLLFSTYFGGSGYDTASGAAIDSSGNLFVAGRTESTDFPTMNPIQATNAGGFDAFVAKMSVGLIEYAATVEPPINADGSSVFGKRGVIPVKFTLSAGGVSTCSLPPATISLTRTAGTVDGPIDESVYVSSADNGTNFRIDSCQYVYNLDSKSLGPGTYLVQISINNVVVGNATFGLN